MPLVETDYCSNNTGYTLSQNNCQVLGTGGVNKAYVSQFSSSTVFQYLSDNTISGMTGNPAWFTFDCYIESASGEEDGKINLGNASQGVEQKFTLFFPKGTNANRNQIHGLRNQVSRIAILDMNGDVRMYGALRGLYCTSFKTKTGKSLEDGSGWVIEFTSKEKNLAPFLTGTSALSPTPVQ